MYLQMFYVVAEAGRGAKKILTAMDWMQGSLNGVFCPKVVILIATFGNKNVAQETLILWNLASTQTLSCYMPQVVEYAIIEVVEVM